MIVCRKRGFTLIELLVVIAIIALLLSIVMPALKEAKLRAQAVICRSNLKQWGLIFSLYAQNNDQSLPQSIAGGRLSAREAFWMGATLPYYGDGKIRTCPSTRPDQNNDPASYDWDDYGLTFEEWGPIAESSAGTWWDEFPNGSYGNNEWCSNPPSEAPSIWGFPPTDTWRTITAKGGGNIPLFLDCLFVDGFPLHDDSPPSEQDEHSGWSTNAMRVFCVPRHKGGINGVFLDMSARKIGLKELWKLKWHINYDTGNPWTQPDAPWPEWMRGFTK